MHTDGCTINPSIHPSIHPGVARGEAHGGAKGVRVNGALNFVLVTFSLILSLFLWLFTGYHLLLICTGLTTKEHLKGKLSHRRPLCQRVCGCACVWLTPSEIEPRKLVPRPVPIISVDQL